MAENQNGAAPVPSLEDIQRDWHDLTLRIQQSETECRVLEQENKTLRGLIEKVVEHRKKSHGELVNLITTLVTKLPINDVGVIVSRLVEHSNTVNEVSAALIHGKNDENILQPAILKLLDKVRRDLLAAIRPLVEELIRLETPLDPAMLLGLVEKPDSFFAPANVRACRAFVKGQLPREQIVRDFTEEALGFFKDLTTDPKQNPRPRQEEIMLAFRPDFEELLRQDSHLPAPKRAELTPCTEDRRARKPRVAPAKTGVSQTFVCAGAAALLRPPEHGIAGCHVSPSACPPDRTDRVAGENDKLDENICRPETARPVVNADYRKAVVNNFGKTGGIARTLRYTLTFRGENFPTRPAHGRYIKHLIPRGNRPRRRHSPPCCGFSTRTCSRPDPSHRRHRPPAQGRRGKTRQSRRQGTWSGGNSQPRSPSSPRFRRNANASSPGTSSRTSSPPSPRPTKSPPPSANGSHAIYDSDEVKPAGSC